jgi:hypothetical protein
LDAYIGPQEGKTYVYSTERLGGEKAAPVTVAAVAGRDKNSRVTCSPASVSEYSQELRSKGARPVVSKIEIRDGAIVSLRGRTETTLLREPVRPGPQLWQNRQSAVLPNGKRTTTVFHCGIAEIGNHSVFGQIRNTVSVQCVAAGPTGGIQTSTTYAQGLGAIEDTTEFSDSTGATPDQKIRHALIEIRDGADECAALVQTLSGADDSKAATK